MANQRRSPSKRNRPKRPVAKSAAPAVRNDASRRDQKGPAPATTRNAAPATKAPARPAVAGGRTSLRPPGGGGGGRARARTRAKQKLGGILAVLIVGGLVAAIIATSRGSHSSNVTGRGPEGIPVQAGTPLAPINSAPYGQPIDGIQCQASEQVVYHIHAHLAIYVDGQPKLVPYGVGIAPPLHTSGIGPSTFVDGGGCFYWLHTHASDGVIHVESPSHALYTLGQFFDIWGQPLGSGQVGPAVGQVTAYVNGKPYAGDLRAIQLHPDDNIQFDVGNPVVPPQQGNVDFSGTGL